MVVVVNVFRSSNLAWKSDAITQLLIWQLVVECDRGNRILFDRFAFSGVFVIVDHYQFLVTFIGVLAHCIVITFVNLDIHLVLVVLVCLQIKLVAGSPIRISWALRVESRQGYLHLTLDHLTLLSVLPSLWLAHRTAPWCNIQVLRRHSTDTLVDIVVFENVLLSFVEHRADHRRFKPLDWPLLHIAIFLTGNVLLLLLFTRQNLLRIQLKNIDSFLILVAIFVLFGSIWITPDFLHFEGLSFPLQKEFTIFACAWSLTDN